MNGKADKFSESKKSPKKIARNSAEYRDVFHATKNNTGPNLFHKC